MFKSNCVSRLGAIALMQGLALATLALPAAGQEVYPSKRFELIVPFAAGSATDGFARIIADSLSRQTGQPVTVLNRPGANSMIAVRATQAAPKDGYTFVILSNGIVVEQVLKKGTEFDVRRDLIPVARGSQSPYGLFASNAMPLNSLKELIDYAKKNPGKVNYASAALGSSAHLATERMMQAAGIKMTHITYPQGTAQINVALMAGDVWLYVNEMGSMKPLVADKRIRILAVTDAQRASIYPDAPSMAEAGVPELANFSAGFFFGFFLPPGTDSARVEKLATDINRSIAEPATRDRLVGLGYNPALLGGTRPADFRKIVLEELERVEKVARDAKLQLN